MTGSVNWNNFALGGFGSDPFGEVATAQIAWNDRMNDGMRSTLMREYVEWQRDNHGFYPDYDKDVRKVNFLNYGKFMWAAAGVAFGLTVINPNFTMRRSIYMRKIAPALMGTIGFMWGKKKLDDHMTNMMLTINEYCPFEVRRCLATKDFRYIANFDYTKPGAV